MELIVSTSKSEKDIYIKEVNKSLVEIKKDIVKYTQKHNRFLRVGIRAFTY